MQVFFSSVLLPAVCALALFWMLLRRSAKGQRRLDFLIGLIVALCFAGAYFASVGGFRFPPAEATHWLPYLAIIAAGQGIFFRSMPGEIWRLLTSGLAVWATTESQLWTLWSPLLSVSAWLGGTVVLFGSSRLLGQFRSEAALSQALVFSMTTGIGGILIALTGTALLGQLTATLGLILLALFIALWVSPIDHLGEGVAHIYMLLTGSILINACLFSNLPWLCAVLLWFAPLGSLMVPYRERQTRKGRLLYLVISALPAAALIAAAVLFGMINVHPEGEM